MVPINVVVLGFLLTAAINLVAIAVAWGVLKTTVERLADDMQEIKAALGLDGQGSGIYLRRDQAELLLKQSDRIHDDHERRLAALERR